MIDYTNILAYVDERAESHASLLQAAVLVGSPVTGYTLPGGRFASGLAAPCLPYFCHQNPDE